MIIILPLLAGIAIGAVVTAVVDRRRCNAQHSDRRPNPTRREDTAISRDLNENAGGSRHIRTHPSWRDRLEQPHTTGQTNRFEESS